MESSLVPIEVGVNEEYADYRNEYIGAVSKGSVCFECGEAGPREGVRFARGKGQSSRRQGQWGLRCGALERAKARRSREGLAEGARGGLRVCIQGSAQSPGQGAGRHVERPLPKIVEGWATGRMIGRAPSRRMQWKTGTRRRRRATSCMSLSRRSPRSGMCGRRPPCRVRHAQRAGHRSTRCAGPRTSSISSARRLRAGRGQRTGVSRTPES